jgi:hypothetical protein
MIPLSAFQAFCRMKHHEFPVRDNAMTGESWSASAASWNFRLNHASELSHPSQSIEYMFEAETFSQITNANVTWSIQLESRPNISIDWISL